MKLLAIGDVCGSLGTDTLIKVLPRIKRELNADIVIVNGENSAIGNGITPESANMIFSAGADVITGGNHSFRRAEILPFLDQNQFILRPYNVENDSGRGYLILDLGRYRIGVINLLGQIYLERLNASNPFKCADLIIDKFKSEGVNNIFVDFHAEATSEKRAMGFYLDGKVTALFGTHTHVQTADAQVLEGKTGYITDLGMTGPMDSVLGVKKEIIINRLKDGDQSKFEFASGKAIVCGALFDCDYNTGRCMCVTPVTVKEDMN